MSPQNPHDEIPQRSRADQRPGEIPGDTPAGGAELPVALPRLRQILDSMPDAVALLDLHGRIVAVNRAWAEAAQSSAMSLVNGAGVGSDFMAHCRQQPPHATAVPHPADVIGAVLREGLALGEFEYYQEAVDHPSEVAEPPGIRGQWFALRVAKMMDGNGGAVVIHADITGRKRLEVTARRNEARLRAILDDAVDAIISINERGIMLMVNPAVERLFGFTAGEVIGRNVSMLMPSPDREHHDQYLRHYLETGEAHIIGIGREVTGRHKDGTLIPLHLAVSEVVVDGRRSFIGVLRDVSDMKAAIDRQNRLIDELRDALERVKRLSGLLPICASCKKIRDDRGYWNQLENYISEHSEAEFSHGLCPACLQRLYPEYYRGEDTPTDTEP